MTSLPSDFDRAVLLLEAAQYTFAKSMPDNPHWYTLRDGWRDEDFVFVVLFIREHGKKVRWPANSRRAREYTVFEHNGFRYWTMGAPIAPAPYTKQDTYLINRAKIEQ